MKGNLFEIYAQTKDIDIRNEIVEQYQWLIKCIAKGFLNWGESLDDLIQEGNVGLFKAIDKFDPKRRIKFNTFARAYIRGYIQHYLRDKCGSIYVSKNLKELANKIHRITIETRYLLGREPTNLELAIAMNTTEERLLRARKAKKISQAESIESILNDNGELTLRLSGVIGCEDSRIADVIESSVLRPLYEALYRAIDYCLDDQIREIIKMNFYQEISNVEIAKIMDIPQHRVSGLKRIAMKRLRKILVEDYEIAYQN